MSELKNRDELERQAVAIARRSVAKGWLTPESGEEIIRAATRGREGVQPDASPPARKPSRGGGRSR